MSDIIILTTNCKCSSWVRDENDTLSEHHPKCKEYKEDKESALDIIVALLSCMEGWAMQTEYIPDYALICMASAKLFLGIKEENPEPLDDEIIV